MGLFQVVCMGLVAAVARSQELQNCSAGNVPFTVGSTEDAAALATALECSNGDFAVQWVGEVFVAETIRVTSGTHLDITGAETGGMADGLSSTQLFVVEGGSTLHLSDMTLARGNASFGGAIYSKQSSVSFGGNTSFISNSAIEDGGAIYADESTVSWDDDGIRFVSNSAVEAGGAISAWWGSAVSWDGNGTLFISNSAEDGGAIDASLSTVSWDGGGTQFHSNSASSSGGAISASEGSTVSWGGDGTQFGSNFALRGGAISAWESTVVWDSEGTQFSSNSASAFGGAIIARSSNVSWDGSGTQFGSNSADAGGAISAWESTVFWHGDATQFSYNSAIDGGGAILAWDSIVSWDGDNTKFVSNSASSSSSPSFLAFGGAIEARESTVSWDGDSTQFLSNSAVSGGAMYAYNSAVSWGGDHTQFGSNSASGTDDGLISTSQYGGGAIHATRGSTVSWLGDGTRFSSNFAAEDGGAIYALDSSTVSGNGTATFDSNVAGTNGGALAIAEHTFLDPDPFAVRPVYVDATFVENSAASGGALHLSNSRALHFINATFRSNSAGAGGAVFAYVAGDDNYPIDFDECVFSGNQANGSGGAVETLAGLQRFSLCEFEGNSAGLGGALSLGGTAWLSSCGFLSNSASLRGPAVFAAGVVEEISFASFEGNELLCAIGSYQQDTEEGGKRYDTVCLDCPEWDECLGCTIQEESVTPTCEAPLEHTTATGPGTTVETLAVDEGYWRTSRKSSNILACYNAEACTGGQTGADGFCAPGYAGSYCAVCDTDYSPSLAHTCTRCSVSRRHGFIAATVIAALVAIFAIVKLVRYLLSNELEGEEGVGWFHRRVLSAVPVQALKIIVVAWQILTQFAEAAHVTFPGVYQDFLSSINVFNFDLGSVFAAGCLWPDMDFHDRLLVNTTGPLVVVGFLAITYWIAVRRNSGTTSGQPVERIRQKHLTALVLFTFLIYSSVSTTVFQTFACETLDDEIEYLRADYRIHCTDAKHEALEVYAGIMVFVYPFGIPLLYAVLLFQRRGVLAEAGADKTVAQSTAGLWEPYRSERFYYEVVECGRRIMLTGVVVFIFPGDAAQIAITLLTTFIFLLMFEVMSPYKSEFDTWLSRGGHVIVFFSMFDALLLKVDVSDESDESQAVFAGVLVTGHVLMVLAIVVEVVGICYASGRKQAVVDTVVSLLPVDLGVEPALDLI